MGLVNDSSCKGLAIASCAIPHFKLCRSLDFKLTNERRVYYYDDVIFLFSDWLTPNLNNRVDCQVTCNLKRGIIIYYPICPCFHANYRVI